MADTFSSPDAPGGYTTQEWLQQHDPGKYWTPGQIKSSRDYAQALMTGSGQQPVRSWQQGVSNMVNALVGGMTDYNAAQREKQAMNIQSQQAESMFPKGDWPTESIGPEGPRSDTGDLSQRQRQTGRGFAEGGQPDFGSDLTSRVANWEGYRSHAYPDGSQYSIGFGTRASSPNEVITPEEAHQRLHTELAYAQNSVNRVLPEGAPQSARDALTSFTYNVGDGWTHGSLLASALQRGDYQQAAQLMQAYNHSQGQVVPGLVSRRKYEAQWMMGGLGDGGGQQSQAAAYQPAHYEDQTQQSPAVQAISAGMQQADNSQQGGGGQQVAQAGTQEAAARGGGRAAPQQGMTNPMGGPGGQIYIDPRFIPQRPGVTREQFQAIMSNPWTPDAQKQYVFQMMQERGKPIIMPGPNGVGSVIIDPHNPYNQTFRPDPPQVVEQQIGDIHTRGVLQFDWQGHPTMTTPEYGAPGPQSSAAPASAPAGGGGGGPGVTPITAQNAPAGPAGATNAPSGPAGDGAGTGGGTAAPVQVASLDPSAGVAQAAAATGGGETPAPATQVAAAEGEKKPPLTQLAQNDDYIRRMVGPTAYGAWKQQQAQKVQQAGQEESARKDAELAAKDYSDNITAAKSAVAAMPEVQNMIGLTESKNIHFGPWHHILDQASRFTGTNAPNEIFDKNRSALVLRELRPVLQGTGQIRVMEVNLMSMANANRDMSKEANQAVLEITRRQLQRAIEIGDISSAWKNGDDVVDPISGKVMVKAGEGDRTKLGADFHKMTSAYGKEHPLISDDENKNWTELIKRDLAEADKAKKSGGKKPPAAGGGGGGGFPTPRPEQIEELKNNPAFRDSFEKHFGPGSAGKALGGP